MNLHTLQAPLRRSLQTASLLALTTFPTLLLTACFTDVSAPGVDDCSNLRQVKASGSGEASGRFGSLDDFEFSASGEGQYEVVPPDTSPCSREIAAKLEAACRICDNDPDGCQDTVESVLNTPNEACAACGDDICDPGENIGNCPQDCGSSCGDNVCDGTESVQSCPTDCANGGCGDGVCSAGETPVNCSEDCGTACGNGICDGDESFDSCPQDCTSPCGDGVCSAGENPANCARDCGAPCGNDICDSGESPILCPQDCGGCEPNRAECDQNTLVVCNTDGVSSTRRQCGSDNICDGSSCRAANPTPGQTDIETTLLGLWRISVDFVDENDAERPLPVGNATYILEIFDIDPPSAQFGVWEWKGALKADSLCFATRSDFDAQSNSCNPFTTTSMGSCSQATCSPVTESAISGRFNSVENVMTVFSSAANTHTVNAQGYLAVDVDLSGEGILTDGVVGSFPCTQSCFWRLKTAGAYEETPGSSPSSTYPNYSSSTWSASMSKID